MRVLTRSACGVFCALGSAGLSPVRGSWTFPGIWKEVPLGQLSDEFDAHSVAQICAALPDESTWWRCGFGVVLHPAQMLFGMHHRTVRASQSVLISTAPDEPTDRYRHRLPLPFRHFDGHSDGRFNPLNWGLPPT
jgi:hypothetical protein